MRRQLILLTACAALLSATEPWRPLFHFSPRQNWTNDPNGLVYAAGEYHLFFQYNPFGDKWGHMSWGHAVSRDLARWRELPVAIPEANGIMAFSGSAVVDKENTSGLGRNAIVCIYTGHRTGLQNQNIAYSTDAGRTWTEYQGNPVIDIHAAEFRDPMVFWHAPSRQWVMVVSLANLHKVRFYGSPDLKHWTALSDFGPAGAPGLPNWECPSLFEMPVTNAPGVRRWVLMLGGSEGGPAGGSATQYFLGNFDGRGFTNDNPPDKALWVDYGADFYAAQTWSDVPAADGRRIALAWMNNWGYADKIPTHPWRGQMSAPREFTLRQSPEGVRLVQTPVRELRKLRAGHFTTRGTAAAVNEALRKQAWGETLEIVAEFPASDAGVRLRKGPAQETIAGYDAKRGALFIDRTHSGDTSFSSRFAARHEAPLAPENGKVKLHILLDRCSVEVFGNGGRAAITDLIFPADSGKGLEVYGGGPVSIEIWKLK